MIQEKIIYTTSDGKTFEDNILDDDSPRNRTKIMTRITMADKLLYRAKRTDNSEWVTGGLMKYLHKFYIDYCKIFERFQFEVDPSTICKCIGRADRNNVMIFEHDVIAYVDTRNTGNGREEVDCVGEVIWDEDTLSFQVTNRLSAESWQIIDGDCKVIGNAFDNPELLGANRKQMDFGRKAARERRTKMDDLLKNMKKLLEDTGAGYVSVKVNNYTVILTDDEQGADYLKDAWDRYVDEGENTDENSND